MREMIRSYFREKAKEWTKAVAKQNQLGEIEH